MKNEVGIVICACRKHCNLTQRYMAFKLSITIHSYANIEKGRVDLSTEKLVGIAKLFGINSHQILALAEEVQSNSEQDWLPDMVKRMIRAH